MDYHGYSNVQILNFKSILYNTRIREKAIQLANRSCSSNILIQSDGHQTPSDDPV